MEMQGGVLVAKKERGGFGLATFATGIVYGLQVSKAGEGVEEDAGPRGRAVGSGTAHGK